MHQPSILCRPDTNRHCLARLREAFRRRNFFLRHFQRCFPCFFHAREPLFMRVADLLSLFERFAGVRKAMVGDTGFEPVSPA